MKKLYNTLTLAALLTILAPKESEAQITGQQATEGAQIGMTQQATNYESLNPVITGPSTANIQFYNPQLGNQLDEEIVKTFSSAYYPNHQGFTAYATPPLEEKVKNNLKDSYLVGIIELDTLNLNSVQEAADSTYAALERMLKMHITDIDDLKQGEFKMYPNPTSGPVNLEGISKGQISVYDITGKEVNVNLIFDENNNKAYFDLSGVAGGMYLIRHDNKVEKLIKR